MTQALKAAHLPKNIKQMKNGDINMNPRHMQQTLAKMGQVGRGH